MKARQDVQSLQNARDILKKWSSSDLLQQIESLPGFSSPPRADADSRTESKTDVDAQADSDPSNSSPEFDSTTRDSDAEIPGSAPLSVAASATAARDTAASDIAASATAASDTAASDTVASDTVASDTVASDTVASATLASDIAASDTAASNTAASDTVASDTAASDAVASDAAASDTVASDTVASDTVASDTVASDTVASDAAASATAAQEAAELEAAASDAAGSLAKASAHSVDFDSMPEAPVDDADHASTADLADGGVYRRSAANPAPQNEGKTRKVRSRQITRRPLVRPTSQPPEQHQESTKGAAGVTRKLRVDLPLESNSGIDPNFSAQQDRESGRSGSRMRIDGPQDVADVTGTSTSRSRASGRHSHRYIDEPHERAARGPHFEVTPPARSNLSSMTGQFLAYVGVLGLTVGTSIVIFGHFGGHSDYTPTGWLITTVAQMLLFLGVINLVSGGIEKTNDDVAFRINSLGDQLMRIEQVTEEALRGPKISPRRYAGEEIPESESRHEVEIGRRD